MAGEQSEVKTDVAQEDNAPAATTTPEGTPAPAATATPPATPAKAEERKQPEKTYTQAEVSKIQSNAYSKVSALERQLGELQETNRLFQEALLEMQAGGLTRSEAEDDVDALLSEGERPKGKKIGPKLATYQKHIQAQGQRDTQRQTEAQVEKWRQERVDEAVQTLTEAGLTYADEEVVKVMAPLVQAGKFQDIPAAARKLAFGHLKTKPVTNEAELRTKIEREIRQKYGLDQQDLGTGGPASSWNPDEHTSRENIRHGIEMKEKLRR